MSTPPVPASDPYAHERDLLIRSLRRGQCVPILGAGACFDHIPLGGEMAARWASWAGYPMGNVHDLAAVMQYVTTMRFGGDPILLKEEFVANEIAERTPPDFSASAQVHAALAGYALPLYVTTNYDDFMYLALRNARRDPIQVISPWFDTEPGVQEPEDEPTPERPWVYHLHGHYSVPQSLVLTEDDYIDFLVRLARGDRHRGFETPGRPVAPYVLGKLRQKRLLFVGYSLRDWTFLVLFRTLLYGLPKSQQRRHVSVQVDPGERDPEEARAYLEKYMADQKIDVFWESAQMFATRLSDWEKGND